MFCDLLNEMNMKAAALKQIDLFKFKLFLKEKNFCKVITT